MLLIIASYVFYAFWDYRFLFLLIFSTAVSYFTGLKIFQAKSKSGKKIWLLVGIVIGLGLLAVFKYYNFFIDSFANLLRLFGLQPHVSTLWIILPVGISFYTFHGLSYILDIYHERIEPTKNAIDYSLFICFFPLLVAGPIERATHLLPQLKCPRTYNASTTVDGLRQILWGLFTKIVVADNCATYANQIFDNYHVMPANALIIGVVLFAFQLYGDFSGYSNIAIGTGRLFGIELMQNFNYPYFATSFADYWKRNHISMTRWFMDYVYYPMVGSSDKLRYWNFCMIITFLLSGLWHGSNWTFVLWGLYQGIFIVISMNSQRYRKKFEKRHQWTKSFFYQLASMFLTFGIVCFGLIFFRSSSISSAGRYISGIFSTSLFSTDIGQYGDGGRIGLFLSGLFVIGLLGVEWIGRKNLYAIADLGIKKRWHRYLLYYALIFLIIVFSGKQQQFVYFQF